MSFVLTEEIVERWKPVVESEDPRAPKVTGGSMRSNLIRVLENTTRDLNEATATGDVAQYTPVLISLIRRTMPTLVANDLVGVQALSTPSGVIFAQRVYYGPSKTGGTETWYNQAPNKDFSGPKSTADGEALGWKTTVTAKDEAGTGTVTALGPGTAWAEMSFSIDSINVACKTRALKGKLTTEVISDLKTVHGLDAEQEIANILQTEIVAEIDREIVALLFSQAKPGCAASTIGATTTPGTWDATADTDGRWEAEKMMGLMIQIEKEAAIIAQETRRGRGNFIVTNAGIAGALSIAGKVAAPNFDYGFSPIIDSIGISFQGILAGRFKLYVDPYMSENKILIGYKGANSYDSGVFYCPYIPLQFMKATGEEDFGPRLGIKSRYGIAINPYAPQSGNNLNPYYRVFNVTGL